MSPACFKVRSKCEGSNKVEIKGLYQPLREAIKLFSLYSKYSSAKRTSRNPPLANPQVTENGHYQEEQNDTFWSSIDILIKIPVKKERISRLYHNIYGIDDK